MISDRYRLTRVYTHSMSTMAYCHSEVYYNSKMPWYHFLLYRESHREKERERVMKRDR